MRILFTLLLLAAPLHAADEAQLRGLEARLDLLLADMLGPGRGHVFLSREKKLSRENGNLRASSTLWEDIENQMESAPTVLPGFKVPRSLREEVLRALKQSLGDEWSSHSTLRVKVIIDQRLSAQRVETVRTALRAVLPLDESTGDSIQIVLAPMQSRPVRWNFILLAPLIVLVCGVLWLLATQNVSRPRFDWPRWAPAHRAKSIGTPAPPQLSALGRRHVPTILGFLAGEPPDMACSVLRQLSDTIAAQVFRRMSTKNRLAVAEVLLLTARVQTPGGDAPERLLSQVSAYEAGFGLLEHILQRCSERMREQTLRHLSGVSYDLSERLRDHLISLADLAAADEQSLRTCLCPYSIDELSLALYEVAEPARRRIIASLPIIIGDMLRVRARYFVPETYEAVDAKRGEVLTRWKRLEHSGRVKSLYPAGAR